MKVLYNLMSINKAKTTAYYAQGNGQCEHYKKHMVAVLKKLVEGNQRDWPNKLNFVCFALNSSLSATTQFTPFKLQFGKELKENYKTGASFATTYPSHTAYLSCDLQKVKMLPDFPGVKSALFTQRIAVYNETFSGQPCFVTVEHTNYAW